MNLPGREERISRYLDGDMGIEAWMAFEADLRSEPELREQTNLLADSLALLRGAFPVEAPPLRLTLRAMALVPPRGGWAKPFLVSALPRSLQRVRGHQSSRRLRRIGGRLVRLSFNHP